MALINAFRAETAQNMQLGAGILVANLPSPETFTGTIPEGAINLGATSGDVSFSYTPEFRNIFEDVNGAMGNYMNGQVIDNVTAELTGSMKEITAENIKLALGANTTSTKGNYDIIKPSLSLEESDYLDNICWVGSLNKTGELIIIELKNALNTAGFSFSAQDKGSASVEFTFVPHFDLSKADDVPIAIYMPKRAERLGYARDLDIEKEDY